MENYPKMDGVNPSFTLTSKVIAQGVFEKTNNTKGAIGDYISTADQSTLLTEDQNTALRNSWLANFRLNSSTAVNGYNSAVKKANM